MKTPTFKKQVDDYRLELRQKQQQFANKWWWEDESNAKVIKVGTALAIQIYKDKQLSENHSLFNSTASVHVFYSKKRFSYFKRPTKKQSLLYDRELVSIEGWGEVSLPLKVENQISLLVLKNVAYISSFSLNLVLLGVLENQSFRWHHWSSEIQTRESQIIESTIRQGKNYKIGNSLLNLGTALATLAITSRSWPGYIIGNKETSPLHTFNVKTPSSPSVIVNKNQFCTYNQLYATALPNIWHCQMGHINLLELYKLRKNCLGVKLWGKIMSQYTHYALSKISQ